MSYFVFYVVPIFARVSASSFPLYPLCPGIQLSAILLFCAVILIFRFKEKFECLSYKLIGDLEIPSVPGSFLEKKLCAVIELCREALNQHFARGDCK